MAKAVAQRAQWRVVAQVLEHDPKAAEVRTRNGDLPRDVAVAKGAPWEVLDRLVALTPYTNLAEVRRLVLGACWLAPVENWCATTAKALAVTTKYAACF